MPDPTWLPEVLRAAGLKCEVYPGAMDRGHGDFGEIWGVMIHHTGDQPDATPAGPGPIANHPTLGLAAQLHLARDGKVTVCGVGIAWHAGTGSYPGLPTNDANRLTIAIEAENNGTEGWHAPQYNAFVLTVAAILRKLGHDSTRAIAHWQWAAKSQGKWDPGGLDMPKFRRDVQAILDGTTGGTVASDSQRIAETREQLTGGKDGYPGWKQLGGLTLVDAVAAVGEKLGIPGFHPPKEPKESK